jgi:hypothetical protein
MSSPVLILRMGGAESLARPKIAMIEKMTARVQMKTEPRIAPPTARLILNEKCASIVLTRWPLVRLKNNAKKNAERSNHEEERYGRHVLLRHTGKKESWNVPECPGNRHYYRRDPRAKPVFKVGKKEASPSQFLAHCASKDLQPKGKR